jgi:gas vesicle protein
MSALNFLTGAVLGGGAGWWLAAQRGWSMVSRTRADMAREVRQWRDAAEQAGAEVVQLRHEAEAWAAGHEQGLEDLLSLMPLLMEVQQRSALPPAADTDDAPDPS